MHVDYSELNVADWQALNSQMRELKKTAYSLGEHLHLTAEVSHLSTRIAMTAVAFADRVTLTCNGEVRVIKDQCSFAL